LEETVVGRLVPLATSSDSDEGDYQSGEQ